MLLKVFFSWQMETDLQNIRNKEFLLSCINSVIKKINAEKKVKGATLSLYQGLERVPGNAEVAKAMFDQIDACNLFIGDFTVVQKICSHFKKYVNKKGVFFRYTPNCNVYGEYNRALGKNDVFWKQVVLVMNKVNGDPHEDAQEIPFDTRHRRLPITFELDDFSEKSQITARKKFEPVLENAIVDSAHAALENIGAQYSPFESWYEQHGDGRYNFTEIDDNLVDQYRQQIIEGKEPILIVAPESNQNTIFIHRIYDGQEELVNYLYCSAEDPESSNLELAVRNIFKRKDENSDLILIIDRCNAKIFNTILDQKKRFKAPNKVIGIIKNDEDLSCIKHNHHLVDITDSLSLSSKAALEDVGVATTIQQERIGLFCEQDPLLIRRIATTIAPSERNIVFDNSQMTTKLTETQPDSVERTILRALSMFDYVGWREERREELIFILSNKDITGSEEEPELFIERADSVISKNIRKGYITERGRTISITSAPLVRQLANEWLSAIDAKRQYNVISSMLEHKKGRLIKEFHDRFITLSQIENAQAIVENLLSEEFSKDKNVFVSTYNGSMLIEAFAEIAPEFILAWLMKEIMPLSIEELRSLEDGRRNIVWTLRKLCFIPEQFSQSAELMLKLALAENETWSNNATGEFKSLFSIFLPATAASLEIRLECLEKWSANPNYKPMVVQALSRAIHTSDYMYLKGAEVCGSTQRENYQPKSTDEIVKYINGCLRLLLKEIMESSQYAAQALKALEDNIGVLCHAGYGNIILPIIKEVAIHKERDWDKMYDTLSLFKDKLTPLMADGDKELYNEIIQFLKKDDYVSRFVRIEKEAFYDFTEKFETRQKKQQKEYESFAQELYETNSINKNVLEGLLTVECIGSFPFGNTLAKMMTYDEQREFVRQCLEIINGNQKAKSGILTDFVSELSDELFEELIPSLSKSRITYVIFICFGRRGILPDNSKFKLLGQLVKDGTAKVEDFNQYWCNIRIDLLTTDVVFAIFKEVLSHEGGVEPVMHMSLFLSFNNKIGEYSAVANLLADVIINSKDSQDNIITNNQILQITRTLLESFDLPNLADMVNNKILESASCENVYFSPNYDTEEIYRLLMGKYFKTIWPRLSAALLSDKEHYMTYFHLKAMLGASMADGRLPIIMEGEHFDEMLEWCEKNPEIAPARLAGMIVVATGEQFSDEAKELIDRYADRPYVLNELGCNLDSFCSVGSVVPYYESRKKIYDTMLDHSNVTVRDWAKKQSDACNYYAKHESVAEEEKW